MELPLGGRLKCYWIERNWKTAPFKIPVRGQYFSLHTYFAPTVWKNWSVNIPNHRVSFPRQEWHHQRRCSTLLCCRSPTWTLGKHAPGSDGWEVTFPKHWRRTCLARKRCDILLLRYTVFSISYAYFTHCFIKPNGKIKQKEQIAQSTCIHRIGKYFKFIGKYNFNSFFGALPWPRRTKIPRSIFQHWHECEQFNEDYHHCEAGKILLRCFLKKANGQVFCSL